MRRGRDALSTIGLFGLMYFAVNQRREFGVRLALGATRRDVRRFVVADAIRLAWPGIALGAALAVALGFLLRASMFGLTTRHPAPYVIAVIVQTLVMAVASWSPAVRAARSNPLEVLRSE